MSPPPAPEPVIDVQDLYKSFAGFPVLKGINLKMMEGTTTVVLGASGSGKTVLMKHIMGLFKPDQGQVIVDGENVSTMSRQQLAVFRERMGMVFQSSALFDSMTVGDNVAFPMRRHSDWSEDEIQQRVKQKLADVGLEGDFDKMPADLSGGMKKRAGLARAMALDPSILLVDEPSAGLDPVTAGEIDELLVERKRGGTTLVVVTHNIPSARIVGDELAMLDQARIIARGTVDDLDTSDNPLVQAFMRAEGGG